MGFDVDFTQSEEQALSYLKEPYPGVLMVDAVTPELLCAKAGDCGVPIIYLDTPSTKGQEPSVKISFKEGELFHLISLITDKGKLENKAATTLIEGIINHYSGDKKLAYKVCLAFLEEWEVDIENVKNAFDVDDGLLLSRKIHSFKGVLSALGETEASKCIRKMEILVKGKKRDLAEGLLDTLLGHCLQISQDLKDLSLLTE
jgi:hypothetical protein